MATTSSQQGYLALSAELAWRSLVLPRRHGMVEGGAVIEIAKMPQAEPNDSLVELLRVLLMEAEAGTLRGVVAAKLYLNGQTQSVWAPGSEGVFGVHVLGSLNMLVRDWEDRCLEKRAEQ